MAGCFDGEVSVEAPSGTDGTLTVCVDGECKHARLAGSSGRIDFPGMSAGAAVTSTLVLSDGSRWAGETEAVTLQPNGPDCTPSCVIAMLTLTPVST